MKAAVDIMVEMNATVMLLTVGIQVLIGRDQDNTASCLQLDQDFLNLHLDMNIVELMNQAG